MPLSRVARSAVVPATAEEHCPSVGEVRFQYQLPVWFAIVSVAELAVIALAVSLVSSSETETVTVPVSPT